MPVRRTWGGVCNPRPLINIGICPVRTVTVQGVEVLCEIAWLVMDRGKGAGTPRKLLPRHGPESQRHRRQRRMHVCLVTGGCGGGLSSSRCDFWHAVRCGPLTHEQLMRWRILWMNSITGRTSIPRFRAVACLHVKRFINY